MNIVPQLIINSLIAGAIYALVALGFTVIYSTTKFFNLAHGAIAAVGGYTVFFLTNSWGLPLYVAIVLGVVAAGLSGILLNAIIFSPLRKKKATNMILLVASLGVFTMIQGIIAIIFGNQFEGLSTTAPHVYEISGATITHIQLIILVSSIAVFCLLFLLINKTRLGRAIKAVGDDEEVAKIVGINTSQIISKVFFIGSMIAGLAGIFFGLDTGIQPTMGFLLLLKGVIAAVVGGIGTISGAILGAFLLGLIENFGIWHISAQWKDVIAFAVLIVFLLFRPQGIIKK